MQLRAECEGLNQYIKELNLADYGLDARYDLCVVCGEEKARTRGGEMERRERERVEKEECSGNEKRRANVIHATHFSPVYIRNCSK